MGGRNAVKFQLTAGRGSCDGAQSELANDDADLITEKRPPPGR